MEENAMGKEIRRGEDEGGCVGRDVVEEER